MLWLFLIFVNVVSYSLSTILQRILMREKQSDPIAFAIVFQLLTGILIGIYAVIHGFSIPSHVQQFLPNFLITVTFYAAVNIFIFKSLQLIEASEFIIILSSSAVWTILGAIFILKESFTQLQAVGTLLIVSSIVVIFAQKRKMKMQKGHIFALLAAMSLGLAFINDAYILQSLEINSYVSFAFIAPALGIWLFNPKKTKKVISYFQVKSIKNLFLVTLFQAIAAVAVFTAYQIGNNAAVTSSLYKLSTVVTVIFGIFFLHERDNLWRKMLGVVLGFIGAVLLVI